MPSMMPPLLCAPMLSGRSHTHTQTCTRTRTRTCTHTHMPTHTHKHAHAHAHAHTHTHTHMPTHTHTHTHTHTPRQGKCRLAVINHSCEVGLRQRTYHVLSGSILGVWSNVEGVFSRHSSTTHSQRMQIVRVRTQQNDQQKRLVGTWGVSVGRQRCLQCPNAL